MKPCFALLPLVLWAFLPLVSASELVVFEGNPEHPGHGLHIVLVAGDEEYRSEEMLTQMGRILAKHHGFRCTVLYATDPETGEIDPRVSNIPGLEQLQTADLLVMYLRFRDLPEEQMLHIVQYLESGRPVLGIRTSTHAFNIPSEKTWSHYSFNHSGGDWNGGFGARVFGETWIKHHGHHKVEATRGIVAPGEEKHPIAIGCDDIFGLSDVYTVQLPLPTDSRPIILGKVLVGMNPGDPPVENEKNDPLMPILWTKSYCVDNGKQGQTVTSTIGSGLDFESEGVRRLLVNSCYWLLGLQDQISADSSMEFVGQYKPLDFGFGAFRRGVKPDDIMQGRTPY